MIEKDPEKRRGVSDELVDEFIEILRKPYDKRCIMTDMKEKAEPPGPRLIREDFLPNEPMSKYRIKKVTDDDGTRYYPQKKFFFWWEYLNSPSYRTYDEARFDIQKRMKNEKTVEYFYDLDL